MSSQMGQWGQAAVSVPGVVIRYDLGQGRVFQPKTILAEGLSCECSVANAPDSWGDTCLDPEEEQHTITTITY